ncbi:MAG: amino acid adenylation domain-containing protein [Alphaproteobacteria bacterium]|nr:amino acid adenylation domain-containing protein [Alphaproteobacteria bacterium]
MVFSYKKLHHCFENSCDVNPDQIALEYETQKFSYKILDNKANQLAHYLIEKGIKPGSRVGIFLERSFYTYQSILAILKAGAVFVPLDPSFPPERVTYIVQDAKLDAIITLEKLIENFSEKKINFFLLNKLDDILKNYSVDRPIINYIQNADYDLSHIFYTSGSTGQPKGVMIDHKNILNFVIEASKIYQLKKTDRVYQGLIIAFDFSMEEIWPTWYSGATLIAGPIDNTRLGPELGNFLRKNDVTVLHIVPTLLSTIDQDVSSLRLISVGGEQCPPDLIGQWYHPNRRILNTYGPTEATCSATWAELHPGQAVTIGKPFVGYQIYILNDNMENISPGEVGEICIGGVGVAIGYLNQEALTQEKFIPNPFSGSHNSFDRLYKTGDLGRYNQEGNIEYLGRKDSQVKIRGYRIELAEIENVVKELSYIQNVVVSTKELITGIKELIVFFKLQENQKHTNIIKDMQNYLSKKLPSYMVPKYFYNIDQWPLLPNGKIDRIKLLNLDISNLGTTDKDNYIAPEGIFEEKIEHIWADIFKQNKISVEDDFFLDLGGHSLFAAMTISKLRREPLMQNLSITDLYANPTIRKLAARAKIINNSQMTLMQPKQMKSVLRVSNTKYFLCGLAQILSIFCLLGFGSISFIIFWNFLIQNPSYNLKYYLFVGVPGFFLIYFLQSIIFSIIAKWLIIGRFRSGSYPLWGKYYFRCWLVQRIQAAVPLALLSGTPFINIYYRLMGAKIGKNCYIATSFFGFFDLIDIGDNVDIGYGTHIKCSNFDRGYLHIGSIKISDQCFVGNNSIILPNSTLEKNSSLDDQSLLGGNGVIVPEGEGWKGSPASLDKKFTNFITQAKIDNPKKNTSLNKKILLSLTFILAIFFIFLVPILASLPSLYITYLLINSSHWLWYIFGSFGAGLSFVLSLWIIVILFKKILMPKVKAGIYSTESFFFIRKWIADQMMDLTLTLTYSLYATLYLIPFMRLLGAKIGKGVELSTASHITPNLLEISEGSFVADQACIGPARVCAGKVYLGLTKLGYRAFIGNGSYVPGHYTVQNECLIGVLSVPPIDEAKPATSWLGSPAIYLPRRQESQFFVEQKTYKPTFFLYLQRLIYEFFRIIIPPTLYYVSGFISLYIVINLVINHHSEWLILLSPAIVIGSGIAMTIFVVLAKLLLIGIYKPRVEPLWSSFVRRTELITGLYESCVVPTLLGIFIETPLAPMILRLFGVKIGKRTCMATSYITEFDLVRIGNDVAIDIMVALQTHLFEDRVMKMSYVTIHHDASIDTRAVVLYDSVMEAESHLDALSLLMKNETLPKTTSWQGIPAKRYR